MRREADFFGAMFEAADFEAYLLDMKRSKTWGDELTLRAVADALGCVVHVVTNPSPNPNPNPNANANPNPNQVRGARGHLQRGELVPAGA